MQTKFPRLVDPAAAMTFLAVGATLLVWVFPRQIPAGLTDDLSAGLYPNTIMMAWLAAAGAWLLHSILSRDAEEVGEETELPNRRTAFIVLTIIIGFCLFSTVGFIEAASVMIVCLSYLCGERGAAPWILALAVPPVIHVFLNYLLDVRLPTMLPL